MKIGTDIINSFIQNNENVIPELISDGYHTFEELYDFRFYLNALLFNGWANKGLYDVHKSWFHSDGNLCFGGKWFIVVAELPTGQISFHYKEELWEYFNIDEKEIPNKWDGHTSFDVILRLSDYLQMSVHNDKQNEMLKNQKENMMIFPKI